MLSKQMLEMKFVLWSWQLRRKTNAIEAEFERRRLAASANGAEQATEEKRRREHDAKIRAAWSAFQAKMEYAQARLAVQRLIALSRKEAAAGKANA